MSDIPLSSLHIIKRRNPNFKMPIKKQSLVKNTSSSVIPSGNISENHNYIFLPIIFISFGFIVFFLINFNNIL